jgi:opacity protein-like surface antigen
MRRFEKALTATVIACAAIFAAIPALAQTTQTTTAQDPTASFTPLGPEPEGLTISAFLGVGFAGDYDNSPAAFGAALGYGMNRNVSVEGEIAFVPGGEQGTLATFDSSMFTLSGNVLYHFLGTEQFTPYATAGIGTMNTDAEAEGTDLIDDDTRFGFAWNWGAGLKTALSDRIGLRADLRYFNPREDLSPITGACTAAS